MDQQRQQTDGDEQADVVSELTKGLQQARQDLASQRAKTMALQQVARSAYLLPLHLSEVRIDYCRILITWHLTGHTKLYIYGFDSTCGPVRFINVKGGRHPDTTAGKDSFISCSASYLLSTTCFS